MPSTRRWLGHANDVSQVDTLTIAGGDWGTGETITLTIDNVDLVITIGTLVTDTQVATTIKEAFNGDALTDTSASSSPTIADGGGSSIPQMAQITASSAAGVVTLTHDTPGVPFTMTETEAGAGTAVQATATAATGKHFFSQRDNWSGNTVPITADTVVFDAGDVDCKYGLEPAISPAELIITSGYRGQIGLPETNASSSSATYREYLPTYLKLGATNTAINVTIGDGPGSGSGRLKIDTSLSTGTGGTGTTLVVNGSGQRAETGVPSILWKNGASTSTANQIFVNKGDVGAAFFAGEECELTTCAVGFKTNVAGDSSLIIGDDADLATATINVRGGLTDTNSNIATVNMTAGELIICSGTVTTINLDGGDVRYRSTGTMTTCIVGPGGNIDFRQSVQNVTVTNLTLHRDCEYHDPTGRVTVTNGIDFDRCQPSDLRAFEVASHQTWTASAI
ncbi:hypothetical protein [uncultured Mediterranean phage uvDeep-CGR2-KM19-C37]|nr:hypothetical protein [uncultured Mediterranean phage uvDeep-CGR2-KM19-C37]